MLFPNPQFEIHDVEVNNCNISWAEPKLRFALGSWSNWSNFSVAVLFHCCSSSFTIAQKNCFPLFRLKSDHRFFIGNKEMCIKQE